ncbi:MAG: HAD hydrolase-like protein [Burkholderiaceae bacterium]
MANRAFESTRRIPSGAVPLSAADVACHLPAARPVLCDLDGCQLAETAPCPGAIEFLRRFSSRVEVISNNSTETAPALSRRLLSFELGLSPDRMHLAGEAAVDHVANRFPGARVALLCNVTLVERAIAAGLRPARTRADVVLLCRYTEGSIGALQDALDLAIRGVPMVVANPDRWHPAAGGGRAIETGSLLAVLSSCLPGLAPTVIGKPEPTLFARAMGSEPADQVMMIGDNPLTDLCGADALGIPTLLLGGSSRAAFRDLAGMLAYLDEAPARA